MAHFVLMCREETIHSLTHSLAEWIINAMRGNWSALAKSGHVSVCGLMLSVVIKYLCTCLHTSRGHRLALCCVIIRCHRQRVQINAFYNIAVLVVKI